MKIRVNFQDKTAVEVSYNEKSERYCGDKLWFVTEGVLLGVTEIMKRLDLLVYVTANFEVRASRVRDRLRRLPNPLELDLDMFRDVEEYQIEQFGINSEYANIVVENNDFEDRKIIIK